ncbi:MAG: response regulator [Coriobacteriia bacterium]|nr:response regulator [Coriobacteriia bacterium]
MTKVLIADDNRHIRLLVSAALRTAGYELIEAADGEAAIEAAVRERPDLVLLDVVMPKLDGFEVLRFIRKRPETAGCRVIMLTAEGTEADRDRGLESGADGYLVKPFSADRLRSALAELLGGAEAG